MISIDKIKQEDKNTLNDFVGKIYSKDEVIDLGIFDALCTLSAKYNIELCVAINRKGYVVDFFAGDSTSVEIDGIEKTNGLCGIRVIHTHPFAAATLSELDKSALKNLKLDCIIAVAVDERGAINAQVGYIDGDKVHLDNIPNALYINKYGIIENIYKYDKLYKDNLDKMYENSNKQERAVLVRVELKNGNIEEDLLELESLAKTAHIEVVDKLWQKRIKPDGKYFIGEGKLEALKNSVQLNDATVVIFDNELSGGKVANLSSALGVRIIDRSMLILDIFAGRARTAEGKLQVELAQLKYSLPRLSSLAIEDNRFGGGVGMRGPGETKLELNRRIVEDNIVKLSRELDDLKRKRALNRSNRIKNNKPSVAIVGYTNSGKSTLTNLLAKADIYAKDELFATLDTTTRTVWLGDKKEVVFTDTVGFIKNLPHEFIEAFSSTLEESTYATLLMHVIDISNPNHEEQEKVVMDTLQKLNCKQDIITVYNKIDKLSKDELFEAKKKYPKAMFISAHRGDGVEELKQYIVNKLFK